VRRAAGGRAALLPGALTTLALIALHQRDTETARSALSRALAIDRKGEDSELTTEGMACRTLLAWLDLRRDGAPGLTADLAEIVAVAEGTVPASRDSAAPGPRP
jgi:hypothetical protein